MVRPWWGGPEGGTDISNSLVSKPPYGQTYKCPPYRSGAGGLVRLSGGVHWPALGMRGCLTQWMEVELGGAAELSFICRAVGITHVVHVRRGQPCP